jgi:redox-sensing transcriptional repressor
MAKEPLTSPSSETPKAAIARLSLYLRQLESLERDGQPTVASKQLGRLLNLSDAQVRKDLAHFGQFGYPGVGYRVNELRDVLRGLLGVDRPWRAALVGVGNLGRALLGYQGFRDRGFHIVALFDRDRELIGRRVAGLEIRPFERLKAVVREEEVELCVLCVPADAAQQAANAAASAGVVGILNFAPIALKLPQRVSVVSVDLGLQLEQLVFQVNQRLPSKRTQSAG